MSDLPPITGSGKSLDEAMREFGREVSAWFESIGGCMVCRGSYRACVACHGRAWKRKHHAREAAPSSRTSGITTPLSRTRWRIQERLRDARHVARDREADGDREGMLNWQNYAAGFRDALAILDQESDRAG